MTSAKKKRRATDVAAAYDAWSDVYDVDGNPLVTLDERTTVALYRHAVVHQRALDVGCGTGRHTLNLLINGAAHVVGVDASPGMLAKAREKLAHFMPHRLALVEHGDLARLPFDDASFDVVVCALVLEHADDLRAPYAEFARVLKPGGHVVVSDIHAQMRAMTQANFTDPATGEDVLPPSFLHEPEDYANAAHAAGLDVIALHEVKGTDTFAAEVARAKKYVGVPMLTVVGAMKPVTA